MAGIYTGSTTLYTMSSWYSTSRVSSDDSTTESRLNQALALARALQASLKEGQIAIPSVDNDATLDRLEIVVWYKAIRRERLPDVVTLLNNAASTLHLTYGRFREDTDQMTVSFSEAEVNNIRRCFGKKSGIAPGGVVSADAIKSIYKAQQASLKQALRVRGGDSSGQEFSLPARGADTTPSVTGGVETTVSSEPIWLSTAIIDKLRASRGDRLKTDLSGISDAIREVAAATKTGWATFLMVAKGVVTVGSYVKDYVGSAVNLESLEAISVCCSAIGVAGIAVILASVISIITAVVVLLKDCINILIVINNTRSSVLTFTGDAIIYGERGSTTASLPARPGPEFAHAAFFTYRKFHVGPQALGLHGSLFGATFRLNNTAGDQFSVGMDCPLTIFGGTNSIRVKEGSDAEGVAWLAGDCGNEEDTATSPGKTVVARAKRALGLGNANWAYLCFEENVVN